MQNYWGWGAIAIVLAIAGCKNESQPATPNGARAKAAQHPTQQSTTNSGTGDPVQVEISTVQRAVKIPKVSQQQKNGQRRYHSRSDDDHA